MFKKLRETWRNKIPLWYRVLHGAELWSKNQNSSPPSVWRLYDFPLSRPPSLPPPPSLLLVQLTVPTGDDSQLTSLTPQWAHPMAQYKCSTADRPHRRRRPADFFAPLARIYSGSVQLTDPICDDGQLMSFSPRWPACPMAQYKCSTADRPYRV